MFAPRYFAPTYYAPRYWAPGIEGAVLPVGPQPGGGESRRNIRQQALHEDEEVVAVLQALISSRTKN